jgi:uncharacterized membrane protein
MTALAIAVHWLHVGAAIVWVGAQVFVFAALWPALLARTATDARTILGAIMPRAARLFGPSAMLLVLTGLLRGTWLGPVRSWQALATPYGLTFATSLLLVVALMVNGGRLRSQLAGRVWAGDEFHSDARAYLQRQRAIALGGLATVLACMVLMRFGL